MATFSLRRHGHIVGLRSSQNLEQPADVAAAALKAMFEISMPAPVLQFMLDLADSVLYYRYDALSRTGKTKSYSHFVLTSIGPYFTEETQTYQPASTIGFLRRFREFGLPPHYLPFALEFNKTCHLFCDLRQESGYRVVVAKNETAFDDKSWVAVAPSFPDFVDSLQVDLRHVKSLLRLCGPANIAPSFREWLQAALGDDWQAKVEAEPARGKRKAT